MVLEKIGLVDTAIHFITALAILVPAIYVFNFCRKLKKGSLFKLPGFYLLLGMAPLGFYHLLEVFEHFGLETLIHVQQPLPNSLFEHGTVILAVLGMSFSVYSIRKDFIQPIELFDVNGKRK